MNIIDNMQTCFNCVASRRCLIKNFSSRGTARFNEIVCRRSILDRGENLYIGGEKFVSFFMVRSGTFKSSITSRQGQEQITGFHFSGDLLGLDGLENNIHIYTLTALQTSSVCEIDGKAFDNLCAQQSALRERFLKKFSHDLIAENNHLLTLVKFDARQRVVSFLLEFSDCMRNQGASRVDLSLSMTRNDIANYLGLSLETVSRFLKRLQQKRLIRVNQRQITILDRAGLEKLLSVKDEETDNALKISPDKNTNVYHID